jgi:hypothetical protein
MAVKRVLLAVSHLGSGSLQLLSLLNHNPRVQFANTQTSIRDYTDLQAITSSPHKMNSLAAMYAMEINHNFQLGPKNIAPHAHYLFVLRRPEPSIGLMVQNGVYRPHEAAMYYCYRLRRMCEIAKRVGTGMLLTYEDLESGEYVTPLSKFLGLKEEAEFDPKVFQAMRPTSKTSLGRDEAWCEDCYERHLYYLKSLPLERITR